MSRSAFAMLLCALCLSVAPAFAAAMDAGARDDDPAAAATAIAPTPAAPAAPVPMTLPDAIAEALAQERAQVEALAAQLAAAPDDEAALALQRAIEQAKFDAQARVLDLQAAFARREGRLDDAARLEAALGAMGRTPAPTRAEERPAPTDTPNGH